MSLHPLKVAELKARCKEVGEATFTLTQLNIANYSKLNKPQLIDVLTREQEPAREAKRQKVVSSSTSQRRGELEPIAVTANPDSNPTKPASKLVSRGPTSYRKADVSTGPDWTRGPSEGYSRSKLVKVNPGASGFAQAVDSRSDPISVRPMQTDLATHWLGRLFESLEAHRSPPRKAPFLGLDRVASLSPQAFEVALRFWIARLHTALQLGSGEAWSVMGAGQGLYGPDLATWPPVVGCENLGGDLWTVESDARYTVIGETGEVVARDALRADWTAYAARPVVLNDIVKSKDSDDFPQGISKAWRKRAREDELAVAKRTILSSCALNSFSGLKLSAVEMDAEWLSRPVAVKGGKGIELYLPESHQIESVKVEFPIAHIHRKSGFTAVVLCETGQVIGNEDGVAELWRGLLGFEREFWEGWEQRCITSSSPL